uniref:Uncharacterized protein n=1 Tax=Brassica oleracea var. oleracea TaxID=109376 RepID=A0A0D3DKF7_BRAOL
MARPRTTSMSTNGTTSMSIDGMTSETIDSTISTSIDRNTCCRLTPIERPESSSCPRDITNSTLKSTNESSYYLSSYVDREITMEDFRELEEFLKLEDGERLEDWDINKEITMEDFLELENFLKVLDEAQLEDWDINKEISMEDFLELEDFLKVLDEAQTEDLGQDSELKLDDDQHTLGKDSETSPHVSIDRHCPPHIYRHRQLDTDRHHPPDIDRCPLMNKPRGCIVELEPIEERMHKSESSHLAIPEHLRPPICAEEVVGFHKRVKRMHEPVKIVVACAVFEVEFPIPPDRSVHMGSYNGFFDDHMYAVASQRGLRSKGEVDKSPVEAASIDTRCVLEQKGFDVCGNRFEGDTTTGSDKYGGKKRKNWKKRKRIKGDPQLSLIPHFSDGVRKSRVRIRCFSQPFTKLQALLISKMIDK